MPAPHEKRSGLNCEQAHKGLNQLAHCGGYLFPARATRLQDFTGHESPCCDGCGGTRGEKSYGCRVHGDTLSP